MAFVSRILLVFLLASALGGCVTADVMNAGSSAGYALSAVHVSGLDGKSTPLDAPLTAELSRSIAQPAPRQQSVSLDVKLSDVVVPPAGAKVSAHANAAVDMKTLPSGEGTTVLKLVSSVNAADGETAAGKLAAAIAADIRARLSLPDPAPPSKPAPDSAPVAVRHSAKTSANHRRDSRLHRSATPQKPCDSGQAAESDNACAKVKSITEGLELRH